MNDSGAGSPAIEVRDLMKRFGEFVAVDRISFSVRRGEIFGFLGPNGSGKTTTMRMACGLLLPTAGGGTVDGFDIVTESETIKQRIGYMSQRFSLYEDLTVAENLEFYGGVYSVPTHRFEERAPRMLRQVGLNGQEGRLVGTLSAGYKQRVALACAIVHEPSILFLDEPTSGVDPVSRRRFWDIIDQLSASGVTILVTTHVMDEAEFCHRLVLIYQGKRIALGTSAELRAQYPARVLSIEVDPIMEALERLQAEPTVEEVAIFGSDLHVSIAEGAADPERWRSFLEGAGFNVRKVEPIAPSMEDVFVSLVAESDKRNSRKDTETLSRRLLE